MKLVITADLLAFAMLFMAYLEHLIIFFHWNTRLHLVWWSTLTSNSFTDLVVYELLSCIFNLCDTKLSVLLTKMASYLSGLSIISLLLNQ